VRSTKQARLCRASFKTRGPTRRQIHLHTLYM
jgi:hypothetical protein